MEIDKKIFWLCLFSFPLIGWHYAENFIRFNLSTLFAVHFHNVWVVVIILKKDWDKLQKQIEL